MADLPSWLPASVNPKFKTWVKAQSSTVLAAMEAQWKVILTDKTIAHNSSLGEHAELYQLLVWAKEQHGYTF